MPKVQSEYEVEELFIERLCEIGYSYVDLKNYEGVLSNFRNRSLSLTKKNLLRKREPYFLIRSFHALLPTWITIPYMNRLKFSGISIFSYWITTKPCIWISWWMIQPGIFFRSHIRLRWIPPIRKMWFIKTVMMSPCLLTGFR